MTVVDEYVNFFRKQVYSSWLYVLTLLTQASASNGRELYYNEQSNSASP